MAVAQWAPDDELTSDRLNEMVDAVNAFEGIIDGTYDDPLSFLGGLTVADGGVTQMIVNEDGARFPNTLSVGTTDAPDGNLVLFHETTSDSIGQTVSIETNVTAGTAGDYSALRVVMREMTAANNQSHAAEVHGLWTSGGGAQYRSGLTVTVQGTVAGTGQTQNALRIISVPLAWSMVGAVDMDNAILIQQGDVDFAAYFRAYNKSGVLKGLWEKTGKITAGDVYPLTTSAHDLGGASQRWRIGYIETLATESGNVGAPTQTFRGDATSGSYLIAAGQVGRAISGAAMEKLYSGGLRLETSFIGKHATVSTPDSGYTALGFTAALTPQYKDSSGNTAYGLTSSTTARKNRLVNGSFRVKQRTTMPTTDDNYCLDRWILLLEAANAATVAQETSDVPTDGAKFGVRLTVGSGEDNKFGICQVAEAADSTDLRGKTVSLQFKMKSTAGITDVRAAVIEWTSTADSVTSDVVGTWSSAGTNPTLATNWAYCSGYTPVSLAATTSWATYKIEGVTVGASTNNLAVLIWVDDETTTVTTDILRITDVQLEEGAVCTNFERRTMAQEEVDCYRWLYQFTSEYIGIALNNTVLYTDTAPNLPVPMRVTPTAITSATYAASAGSNGSVTSQALSRRCVRFTNTDTNWTSGALIQLTATVSAEL